MAPWPRQALGLGALWGGILHDAARGMRPWLGFPAYGAFTAGDYPREHPVLASVPPAPAVGGPCNSTTLGAADPPSAGQAGSAEHQRMGAGAATCRGEGLRCKVTGQEWLLGGLLEARGAAAFRMRRPGGHNYCFAMEHLPAAAGERSARGGPGLEDLIPESRKTSLNPKPQTSGRGDTRGGLFLGPAPAEGFLWGFARMRHTMADSRPRLANAVPAEQRASVGRKVKSLKDGLRELYKKVHPDLFHEHPKQREVNQRSFQLLQEYIAAVSARSPADARPPQPGHARGPFSFAFFLWRDKSAGMNTTHDNLAQGLGQLGSEDGQLFSAFQHVHVTLPAPQPSIAWGPSVGAHLSGQMALLRLLEACGVRGPFEGGLDSAPGEPVALGRGKGALTGLFQYALELQQRAHGGADHLDPLAQGLPAGAEALREGLREEVVLRSALRRAHGITVRFAPPSRAAAADELRLAPDDALQEDATNSDDQGHSSRRDEDRQQRSGSAAQAPLRQRLQGLRALVAFLDAHPHAAALLRGSSVVLGEAAGAVDARGCVLLPGLGTDGAAIWRQWLSQQGSELPSLIGQRRQRALRWRAMEDRAAEEMEVDMVYADDATGAQERYLAWLEALVAWAEEKGSVSSGRFAQLPLRVFCPDSSGFLRADLSHPVMHWSLESAFTLPWAANDVAGHPFSLHRGMGYLAVPVSATPAEVYAFVLSRGMEALAARDAYRRRSQQLSELQAHCRRKLRLRRLAVDWGEVQYDQAQSAMLRLLRAAREVAPVTEGLSLCLAESTRLPFHGGQETDLDLDGNEKFQDFLRLEWNFDLASL